MTGSKHVRAPVSELWEHYRLGTLVSFSWLPAAHQLGDGLNKTTEAGPLRSAVAMGRLPLPPWVFVTKPASGEYGVRS